MLKANGRLLDLTQAWFKNALFSAITYLMSLSKSTNVHRGVDSHTESPQTALHLDRWFFPLLTLHGTLTRQDTLCWKSGYSLMNLLFKRSFTSVDNLLGYSLKNNTKYQNLATIRNPQYYSWMLVVWGDISRITYMIIKMVSSKDWNNSNKTRFLAAHYSPPLEQVEEIKII